MSDSDICSDDEKYGGIGSAMANILHRHIRDQAFPAPQTQVAALPVDASGMPVNNMGDQNTRDLLPILNVVDARARYLNAGEVLEGAALDSYSFRRDAYLQRQRNIQYDGDPPEEDSAP